MTGVLFAPVSLGPTGCRSARTLGLRRARVYEAPFLDRPGRPLAFGGCTSSFFPFSLGPRGCRRGSGKVLSGDRPSAIVS